MNAGFTYPEVVEAVKAQAEKYFHGMQNIVTHEGYVALAEKMNEIVPVRGDKKKTFFANSGAAALKVIEIMQRDDFAGRSMEIGKKVMECYGEWKEKYEVVGDVRGLGGMIGLEFVKDKASKEPNAEIVKAIVQEAAQHGLMVENAGIYGNVIRFLAPLVMTDEQLEAGLTILENAIKACM